LSKWRTIDFNSDFHVRPSIVDYSRLPQTGGRFGHVRLAPIAMKFGCTIKRRDIPTRDSRTAAIASLPCTKCRLIAGSPEPAKEPNQPYALCRR
jgi:hypothetical protein